ncbi:hypothetical protein MHTCC0001_31060 [Flavobacteriaceae bacterium MHTCC 0001]
MLKRLTHTIIISFVLLQYTNAQNKAFLKTLDSIQELRQSTNNPTLDTDTRLHYAKTALALSQQTKVDSVIFNSHNTLSKTYWDLKLFDEFKIFNKKRLAKALKQKDSLAIGIANLALGRYYRDRPQSIDIAYNHFIKAEKRFDKLKRNVLRAEALFGIAVIHTYQRDYIKSETLSFKALSLLNSSKQSDDSNKKLASYICNNLGIIYDELELYEKSFEYFKKAIELKKQLKGNYHISICKSINNLGKVYKRSGEYSLALYHLGNLTKDTILKASFPKTHILAIGNYAHTLYLSKQLDQLPYLYHKALKFADSTNCTYESIIIHQHLAEYYHDQHQKDSAKYYAYKAKAISEDYYNDDLLKSLQILAKVEDDSIAVKHYDAYIKLNDSIVKSERALRNKFARIEYETDTYKDENERLNTQNILIALISLILILILVLVYIIRVQRVKNKTLQLEKAQQKANEDIYKLTIKQQEKIEEGVLEERFRISEELHDGVINRLVGSRLGLQFLMYEQPEDNKEKYNFYIDEIQDIEKDIRDLSHELKNTKLDRNKDFIDILKSYLDKQRKIHHIDYDIKLLNPINWTDINDQVKINLFRIIQEATHNIVKHAKASMMSITFSSKPDELYLKIIDNGMGFNIQSNETHGIGLKNISSRINKLEGNFKIDSALHKGTTLWISVPI